MHFMDVHQYAFEERSALFGSTYEDSYDNAIHWVDRNIEMVVAELTRLGLPTPSAIVSRNASNALRDFAKTLIAREPKPRP